MSTFPIAARGGVGQRIKELRQYTGLNQKEFAASVGIVQGFLSGLERGKKTPSDTLLIALCNLYEISEAWLVAGEGEMFRPRMRGDASVTAKSSMIPVLRKIGPDFPRIMNDDVIEHVVLPKVDAGSYAIEAYGDFMAPTIRDGDLVVFKPGGEAENGAVILMTNHWGEAILRRYRLRDGEVFCTPDNATYSPFTPGPNTCIIGTVMEVWRKVKL